MKRVLFIAGIFFCSLFFLKTYSQQNLVLNPSFEEVNENALLCSYYGNAEQFTNAISNWTFANLGTSDLFHMSLNTDCVTHPLSTNFFALGNQLPRTGDSMTGIYIGREDGLNYREYIQGNLSEPLEVGTEYLIRFYVSLADNVQFARNNMGIKFFTTPFFYQSMFYIDVTPDANYTEIISDAENWVLVEFLFTPQESGLSHFIIGNFFTDGETQNLSTNFVNSIYHCYYFIDDISISVNLDPPVFEQLGPYCKGDSFDLPAISENGYSGIWSPEIDNQQTTTYTFTPDNSYLDIFTMTIEITEPEMTPVFNIELSSCAGSNFSLPEISDNGIPGVWSPEINTQESATYTFIPEDGYCALAVTIDIEITEPYIEPVFNMETRYCPDTDFSLPEISDNGIPGIWSPEINTQESATYTFIPEDGYCATVISVEIVILEPKDLYLDYYCQKENLYVEVANAHIISQYPFHWTINSTVITETTHLVNLSDYSDLLNDYHNIIEVSATDINSCPITKTITIKNGNNLCLIPKGISPNGDGLNDYLNLENFGGVSLQIFNRYGVKVYENKNYTNQWTGQSNKGDVLPSGTYFYEIVTSRGEQLNGWVQVVREMKN